MLGLVLAGGAARGAYEAGVLRFLLRELPRRIGHVPWPDVVSGTSVGALNGMFAAARDLDELDSLTRRWRQMEIGHVYRLRRRDVLKAIRSAWRANGPFALFDVAPLHEMVRREFPRRALRRAIDSCECRAFIVSATELLTGYNSLFIDSKDVRLDLKPLPGARVYAESIGPEHVLASSALPFLFPPVPLHPGLHVDGGLRQNTPLRPLLRAGADRVLVIGLKRTAEDEGTTVPADVIPNLSFLAGKSLNALVLDPVERDLRQTRDINRFLEWGHERFGREFTDGAEQDLGLRQIHTLFINPTEDLGRIAAETFRSRPPRVSGPLRAMLATIADRGHASESDLLSYLYFDRAFTAQLEQLGFEDAQRKESQIVELLDTESVALGPQPSQG